MMLMKMLMMMMMLMMTMMLMLLMLMYDYDYEYDEHDDNDDADVVDDHQGRRSSSSYFLKPFGMPPPSGAPSLGPLAARHLDNSCRGQGAKIRGARGYSMAHTGGNSRIYSLGQNPQN
jgi:hypothetical protein